MKYRRVLYLLCFLRYILYLFTEQMIFLKTPSNVLEKGKHTFLLLLRCIWGRVYPMLGAEYNFTLSQSQL